MKARAKSQIVQWILIKMKMFYIDVVSNRNYIVQLMASVSITYWYIKCSIIVLYIDRKNFTWIKTVYCWYKRYIDKSTVGKRKIVKMIVYYNKLICSLKNFRYKQAFAYLHQYTIIFLIGSRACCMKFSWSMRIDCRK